MGMTSGVTGPPNVLFSAQSPLTVRGSSIPVTICVGLRRQIRRTLVVINRSFRRCKRVTKCRRELTQTHVFSEKVRSDRHVRIRRRKRE